MRLAVNAARWIDWLVAAALILSIDMASARAEELMGDVSARLIEIRSNYTGASIVLFGTRLGAGDVVVVIRGPTQPEVVRQKSRVGGIWINNESVIFDDVPGFFAVAASRPLREIAPERLWASLQVGAEHLKLTPRGDIKPAVAQLFRDALLRSKNDLGLYGRDRGIIEFNGHSLFRTDLVLPAYAPDGGYYVTFYLVNKGAVVETHNTFFFINKAGFERDVFDFAHQHPALYGIAAIVIAVLGGGLAAALFRR
ncbi:MAG: hypothetical protein EXQ91_09125 [Alphaproteobacteria bacterium]|nr:hypothetical protein [Alphaproteobacteria bacterium]